MYLTVKRWSYGWQTLEVKQLQKRMSKLLSWYNSRVHKYAEWWNRVPLGLLARAIRVNLARLLSWLLAGIRGWIAFPQVLVVSSWIKLIIQPLRFSVNLTSAQLQFELTFTTLGSRRIELKLPLLWNPVISYEVLFSIMKLLRKVTGNEFEQLFT